MGYYCDEVKFFQGKALFGFNNPCKFGKDMMGAILCVCMWGRGEKCQVDCERKIHVMFVVVVVPGST